MNREAIFIKKFVDSAMDHGKYTEIGDYKMANRAYNRVISALRSMKKSNVDVDITMKELIKCEDVSVKTWAATLLLPSNETLALNVLRCVASGSGLVAFGAGVAANEWEAGRLKIPN